MGVLAWWEGGEESRSYVMRDRIKVEGYLIGLSEVWDVGVGVLI